MSNSEIEEIFLGLNAIFANAFPDLTIDLRPETTAADVPGWDSIAHVGLIVTIEEKFGFQFEPEEITDFDNISELAALIAKKIQNA